MLTIDRRDEIKEYIKSKGDVQLKELEGLYPSVSSMTIRRDLAFLESKGYISRTRGGAKAAGQLSPSLEDIYSMRATSNIESKMKIAKKAIGFLEGGRSTFIDSGTTTMCLAKLIPDEYFSIITSGPNIALELARNSNPSVTLVGGQLNRNNLTISGANSLDFIKGINIDIAFMATSGFSLRSGFTVGNFNECELKRVIIKKARKIILLMDSSKIDKNMPYTFAALKDIDIFVTDVQLPEAVMKAAEKSNVSII